MLLAHNLTPFIERCADQSPHQRAAKAAAGQPASEGAVLCGEDRRFETKGFQGGQQLHKLPLLQGPGECHVAVTSL